MAVKLFHHWYNQPTAQFYHVSTDNSFPYNVYGGQQESGSVGIASRGNDGAITFREWHPVGVEEYGYVAADPLDPNIVYGGKISRYDKQTGQVQNISPEAVSSGKVRFLRTAPVLFTPVDNKTLYFAGNVLFQTKNGGNKWQVISPDLSRETWEIPPSVGIYNSEDMKTMPSRGVIYTVAPSYKDINTIWCGTDDGLIHVTRDGGKTWKNVTPPGISSWSKISLMDASHFDVNTAYAAVNRIRCDDMRPHIYKTNDGGKTWKEIVNGLPDDPINVVREDPERKGLLFAGSERAVYVSFDEGEHWQSLRLNMPATSIRDIVIKDDDLVIGTHGRSFWILDDITALRQLNAPLTNSPAILFKPQTAYRVRWDMNIVDTPLPQEEPAGQNPPDGAIIDYYLNDTEKAITMEIRDEKNNLIRKYSSLDGLDKIPSDNVPPYWIRPQQILSSKQGSHRFTWDMHYQPLSDSAYFPMAAIFMNTGPKFTTPWVMPGVYIVKLTFDGKELTQSFAVKMDPRVKTSFADLQKQHDLSYQCYEGVKQCKEILSDIEAIRKQLQSKIKNASSTEAENMVSWEKEAGLLENSLAGASEPGFSRLNKTFSKMLDILQDADLSPTEQTASALVETQEHLRQLIAKWNTLKAKIAGR